jgi:hypothetical protein
MLSLLALMNLLPVYWILLLLWFVEIARPSLRIKAVKKIIAESLPERNQRLLGIVIPFIRMVAGSPGIGMDLDGYGTRHDGGMMSWHDSTVLANFSHVDVSSSSPSRLPSSSFLCSAVIVFVNYYRLLWLALRKHAFSWIQTR